MRSALLFLALALSGCSFLVADVVPAHRASANAPLKVAFSVAPIDAPAPRPTPETVSVSSVIHSAIALPGELVRLEHVIIISCSVVSAIGLMNVGLLLVLIVRQRRGRPVATQAIDVPASRVCNCGAPISPRSKSGRCRQCALDQRRRKTTFATAS
jgi:hypothetical protein